MVGGIINIESKRINIKKIRIKGIKSITKEIVIDFTNMTYAKYLQEENPESFIKSLYGPNGSGKTAIINAFEIYQGIIVQNNYLIKEERFLEKVTNNQTNEITIKVNYLIESIGEIEHFISIKRDEDEFVMNEEKLTQVNSKTPYVIFELKEGKYIRQKVKRVKPQFDLRDIEDDFPITKYNSCFKEIARTSTKYLISKYVRTELKEESQLELEDSIIPKLIENQRVYIMIFSYIEHMQIVTERKDSHSEYEEYKNPQLKNTLNETPSSSISKEELKKIGLNHVNKVSKLSVDQILAEDKEEYEKLISKLLKFLKIFKPNLVNIHINYKQVTKQYLEVEKILEYKDGTQLNLEYESVGIKKLASLFDKIYYLGEGSLVVIDELDAHLHDIVLNQLIKYVAIYKKGTLLFTAHTITPMEYLSKNKAKSVSFLTLDSTLTDWVQKGNLNIQKAYHNGYITDDFGYDEINFIEVFEND